jgi:hypothetical protein
MFDLGPKLPVANRQDGAGPWQCCDSSSITATKTGLDLDGDATVSSFLTLAVKRIPRPVHPRGTGDRTARTEYNTRAKMT